MQVDHIYLIIALVGIAITIGTLIWRMAILHQRCVGNENSSKRSHERIDKLEVTQVNKIEELSSQITYVRETQIRMEGTLNLILKLEEQRQGISS